MAIDVRANDSVGPANEAGQTLGAPTVTVPPANGTAIVNGNGTITYTPNGAFAGTDGFTYQVCDDGTPSECDTATVTVSVQPQISIADVTVTEGNAGTAAAIFQLTLSGASTSPVTASYATANGTASAGPDYQAASGPLTFAPGQTTMPLVVLVNGDTLDEDDETFFVNLSSPSGATIADGQGRGTIVDDDAPPALSIGDVTVIEGNAGTSLAELKVALNVPSGKPVSVGFSTLDGSAQAPADYTAANGTVPFAPGETLKSIFVTIVGETAFEANETFLVSLSSPVNATISDGQAVATIRNDDTAPGGCTITGTPGPDNLDGTPGADVICGLGGNDQIEGFGGNDIIRAGAGADTVKGGPGNDTIVGEAGNDSIEGNAGNDAIDGGAGADEIAGGDGGDSIEGGPGNDELLGGAGNDSIEGNDGADIASGGGGADTMNGGDGNDNFVGNAGDDRIDGAAGSDRVLGDAGNDVVDGGPGGDGSDLSIDSDGGIRGGPGNDILRGEGGDDLLGGGPGNDTIIGGGGVDILVQIASPAAITLNLTTGSSTGEGTDSISGVENATGSPFGDTLIGSAAPNLLLGGGGKDRLWGRAGNDRLSGGDGDDLLRGEGGYDTLNGQAGTDDCNVGPGGGVKFACELQGAAFMLSTQPQSFTAIVPPRDARR